MKFKVGYIILVLEKSAYQKRLKLIKTDKNFKNIILCWNNKKSNTLVKSIVLFESNKQNTQNYIDKLINFTFMRRLWKP